MTEPPPRKRFQIHLSTAIVMMFVAGGLIWANLPDRNLDITGDTVWNLGQEVEGPDAAKHLFDHAKDSIHETESEFRKRADNGIWYGLRIHIYGWPCNAGELVFMAAVKKSGNVVEVHENPNFYDS